MDFQAYLASSSEEEEEEDEKEQGISDSQVSVSSPVFKSDWVKTFSQVTWSF